jgi:hypothetical protein
VTGVIMTTIIISLLLAPVSLSFSPTNLFILLITLFYVAHSCIKLINENYYFLQTNITAHFSVLLLILLESWQNLELYSDLKVTHCLLFWAIASRVKKNTKRIALFITSFLELGTCQICIFIKHSFYDAGR